jgi:hypothetical protein
MQNLNLLQLLIIAGTGRNTGKTTLACAILRKFGSSHPIVSLKITPHFHRNIQSGTIVANESDFYIAEETDANNGKDSSRMLQAGARQSYFIMTKDEHLEAAFGKVLKLVPPETLLVCESGGLRNYIAPGLFFMMTNSETAKPASEKLKLLADRMIKFDGKTIDFDINTIEIKEHRWTLKQ